MNTITKLTGTASASTSAAPKVATTDVFSTQAQKGFWRRPRMTKDGIIFESSVGGLVVISFADLWTLAESHDARLSVPPRAAVAAMPIPKTS